jgi:hypothetical protein
VRIRDRAEKSEKTNRRSKRASQFPLERDGHAGYGNAITKEGSSRRAAGSSK